MRLPAFFGHKNSVNLLPKDAFESSTFGVVLEWALAFGKWVVILTQLVVMGAFLWRFGLDRKLTDLRKEIAQQVAVVSSYSQMEEDFLLLQKRVKLAEQVLGHQKAIEVLLDTVASSTPSDVWYESIALSPTGVSLAANSSSLPGFGLLLSSLQRNPLFTSVSIGKIQDGASGASLSFDISLATGGDK